MKWNDECQKAFLTIKEQLINAPVLVPPRDNVPLFMYMSINDNAMAACWGKKMIEAKNELSITSAKDSASVTTSTL